MACMRATRKFKIHLGDAQGGDLPKPATTARRHKNARPCVCTSKCWSIHQLAIAYNLYDPLRLY